MDDTTGGVGPIGGVDTVGTALMWDVLHFLSRNNLQSNAALSVLWLSISGGKPSNTQGNAWNELQRLGNGGNTQAIYNAGDVTSNQGYIKAGASRTILVGLPTKKLERLERAQNSLKALANAVLWTLDPSFHRAFKEDWRSAPDKRAKDTLALNLSSMGAVNFYQAIETCVALIHTGVKSPYFIISLHSFFYDIFGSYLTQIVSNSFV